MRGGGQRSGQLCQGPRSGDGRAEAVQSGDEERIRALARKATQRPPQLFPSLGTTSEWSQNRPGPHRG
ncbi:unnamed protein product [Rangifer tarandus platyrhynchus]|uniref:Uncharacterized protein n=2 Tax=Rangifer tarandus platyrhynchus TaxID=3082113 RepID=A0ABN8XV84_RANTA|nr:unnamed protein product [Rangifer tarandus platyrhynchus]CAI9691857.1 unnamed protein product [Rangifer tarandus platyrhynchus]